VSEPVPMMELGDAWNQIANREPGCLETSLRVIRMALAMESETKSLRAELAQARRWALAWKRVAKKYRAWTVYLASDRPRAAEVRRLYNALRAVMGEERRGGDSA
jgi:hypothetical protein